MSVVNIKITDLNIVGPNQIAEDDRFLKSTRVSDSAASGQQYVSKTTDLSSITECLLRKERTITKEWKFVDPNKPPTQSTRFDPVKFFNEWIIKNEAKRTNILSATSTTAGNAYSNSTFFPVAASAHKNAKDPTQVPQSSIINLDYVNKITAACHTELLRIFKNIGTIISGETASRALPSFVGMLVFSTKLSTVSALKSKYGNGETIRLDNAHTIVNPRTEWLRHDKEYIFRASGSGISRKSAKLDGGSNSDIEIPILIHTHTLGEHGHSASGYSSSSGKSAVSDTKSPGQGHHGSTGGRSHPGYVSGNTKAKKSGSGSYSVSMGSGKIIPSKAGGSKKVSILEATKNVYVWERIS